MEINQRTKQVWASLLRFLVHCNDSWKTNSVNTKLYDTGNKLKEVLLQVLLTSVYIRAAFGA
jgi:hypothetical protein